MSKRKRARKNNQKNVEFVKANQEVKEEIQKSNRKLTIDDIRKILTVIIAFFALIISFISLKRSNLTLVPKFSIEVLKEDKDPKNLNRILKLYNAGGQIVNPKIKPHVQLELACAICDDYGDAEREAITLIEFSDYFSEEYFYDNNESAFILKENYANELYTLIDDIENDLEKENKCINFFSIKYYFEISYFDYKDKKRTKILYPTSNFVMLNYKNNNNARYFKDIELKEIKQKNEADLVLPLNSDGNFVTIENEDYDNQEISYNESSEEFVETQNIVSNYIINNLEKNSVELNYDESGYAKEVTRKNDTDLITDENGFVIGFMEAYDDTDRIMLIIVVCLVVLFLLIFMYFRKKKRR